MRSSPRPCVLAGLLLAALAAAELRAEGRVVERVLAVVNDVPVLLSEVRLVQELRGQTESAALEAAIDEHLMLQEAERLSQSALPAREAQAAFESLLASAPAGTQLPEAALRRLARRQATILRYVSFRFVPQLRVGEADVRAAYERELQQGASGASFEERAQTLRAQLERAALDERIEAWVRELRAQARIRRNALE